MQPQFNIGQCFWAQGEYALGHNDITYNAPHSLGEMTKGALNMVELCNTTTLLTDSHSQC